MITFKGLLCFLLAVVLLACVRSQDSSCRWPSPAEVFALNERLTGEVVLPGVTDYDNATVLIKNPRFFAHLGAVVFPETVDDVVASIDFARAHSLPVTVISSGHCYIGRSVGNHTFNINLSRMRTMSVNLNDPESSTGASITVQTGANWGDIYKKVDEVGKVAVGGAAFTVSPGGFILGGGYSAMSRMFGLAVDAVTEIRIVTWDGQLRSVTSRAVHIIREDGTLVPDDGSDLWWVLRGGGFGMGVITSYTMTVYDPAPQYVNIGMLYPIVHPLYGFIGDQILDHYSEQILEWPSTWGGYLIPDNSPISIPGIGLIANGTIMIFMLHYGPWEEAMPSIQPMYDFHPEWTLFRFASNYSTFYEYASENSDEDSGFRIYIGNRFVQPDDFEDPTRFRDTVLSIMDHPHHLGCTAGMLGGAVSDVDPSSSSVGEGMRRGLLSLSCYSAWETQDHDDPIMQDLNTWFREHLYGIGQGSYQNEPDYYLENWQQEFWGNLENYDRLLQTKNRYDPERMFTCRLCVGSED